MPPERSSLQGNQDGRRAANGASPGRACPGAVSLGHHSGEAPGSIPRPDRAGAAWAWSAVMPGRYGVSMSAQPIREADPDDPAEILRVLPERWHTQFAGEYHDALETARDMRHW